MAARAPADVSAKLLRSPNLRTLNDLPPLIKARGPVPMLHWKQEGVWRALSARQFYDQVRAAAAHLAALGLRPGDRIGLLSENRPEWLIADFACQAIGVADVPIYPTLIPSQVEYLLADSEARGVFVSSSEQREKILSIWPRLPALEWLCRFDPELATEERGEARETSWRSFIAAAASSTETKKVAGPADGEATFDASLAATPTNQLATLIYTSGTTGNPKGVPLTHANLVANLNAALVGMDIRSGDRRLSFLPLSHITERHLAYCDVVNGVETFFAESIEKVPENLLETKPHAIVAVPRVYEKVALKVQAEAAAGLKRRVLAWAVRVGTELAPLRQAGWPHWAPAPGPRGWLALRASAADRLVYAKLRRRLGGSVRVCIAGGAPLGRALAEFLLALGLVIDEGYGLTETSPVIAVNKPGARRVGSVGKVLPNLEARIAEDGELLVRGPSVFAGYFRRPAETAAAFSEGWFHTGDIGRLDADGFLYITDRKKDLLKTSGGKFIAPQPIEAKLKASPCIAEAMVVGDGRNYACALIVPNFAALEAEARRAGRRWSGPEELCALPESRALVGAAVAAVNAGLARFETIKKFRLLPRELSAAAGEITPTVKVRRRGVAASCRHIIEEMYASQE